MIKMIIKNSRKSAKKNLINYFWKFIDYLEIAQFFFYIDKNDLDILEFTLEW